MTSIMISGPPFSGKSSVAVELSQILRWPAVDIDTLLVKKYSLSCSEQWKQFGEQQFRQNEHAIIKELLDNPSQLVISLGGGLLTYEPSVVEIKKLGWLVCLECAFEALHERLKDSGKLPAFLDPSDLEGSFKTLLDQRQESYRQHGDYFIDTSHHKPVTSAFLIWEEYKRRYGD